MNWLLIFALAIIGVFAFVGWRVGFVKSVFSLISTIAVIIITILVSPIVSNMLKSNEKISGAIEGKLEQVIDLSGVADNLSAEEEKDPLAFIDGLQLPASIKDTIKDYGIDEKDFLDRLDEMVEQAFDDQCTGANPRYPLMSEIKQMYLNAYYGKHFEEKAMPTA